MSNEKKLELLKLLITYISYANEVSREELKSVFSEQTELYLQSYGLTVEEIYEHMDILYTTRKLRICTFRWYKNCTNRSTNC